MSANRTAQWKTLRRRAEEGRPPLIARGDWEYVLASLLMVTLRVVPAPKRPPVIGWLSRIAGRLWYRTNHGSVRRVRRHLRRLFGDRLSAQEIEAHIPRHLSLVAWNSMMVDLLPYLDEETTRCLLPIEGLHHLDAIRRQGKAVLLMGGHFGAFAYVIAAVLHALGYPICEVGHGGRPYPGSSRLYRRLFWPRVRSVRQRFRVIDPQEGPQRALLDAFRRGEVVYLLPDQYFIVEPGRSVPPHLIPLRFLGRTVYLETGGVRLAKRMGAEAVLALPVQEGNVQRVPLEPFPYATDGTRPEELARDLQAFLERLEARVRAQPFLWRDLRRPDLLARLGIFEKVGPR